MCKKRGARENVKISLDWFLASSKYSDWKPALKCGLIDYQNNFSSASGFGTVYASQNFVFKNTTLYLLKENIYWSFFSLILNKGIFHWHTITDNINLHKITRLLSGDRDFKDSTHFIEILLVFLSTYKKNDIKSFTDEDSQLKKNIDLNLLKRSIILNITPSVP